jgi:hypothetical protein
LVVHRSAVKANRTLTSLAECFVFIVFIAFCVPKIKHLFDKGRTAAAGGIEHCGVVACLAQIDSAGREPEKGNGAHRARRC